MVRSSALLFFLLMLHQVSPAQTQSSFACSGILKSSLTISPGFLLQQDGTNIYLDGALEYFTEDHISLRSELFYYTSSQTKPAPFESNHHLMFGALYHFPFRRFDYFAGIEPGISLTKPNVVTLLDIVSPQLKVVPTITVITGITLYVYDYFHFFADLHYMHARYFGSETGAIPLDEITISAGLGLQIMAKKGKGYYK